MKVVSYIVTVDNRAIGVGKKNSLSIAFEVEVFNCYATAVFENDPSGVRGNCLVVLVDPIVDWLAVYSI